MHTHRHKKQPCPWCGYNLDAVTNAEPGIKGKPDPGDVSVCISCAQPTVLNDQGQWAKLSQAEMYALHPDTLKILTRTMKIIRESPADVMGGGNERKVGK